jgi:bacterioferritin
MQGHAKVIELLNAVLTSELTAINQYFIHAKMCQNWGFLRIYERVRAESIDEMKHADQLIGRILFLEGIPNLQRLGVVEVGETVKEQFEADLRLEHEAIARLNQGIRFCEEVADNGSRELLERILAGEEEHTDWLETQLSLIARLGEKAYLAEHLG